MTDHPKHALPVGYTIGGYAIVRVIGQGGFGIVYEAYNSDTEQRVAIKEYYPSSIASRQDGTIVLNHDREREIFDKVLARYRSTALLQLKFDHPNILKIYDYVRAKNTGYMVTEFVDGESMRAVLGRHGGRAPSYEVFRKMFEPVISALAYIHSRGYLHRDIAPDNIMWTKDGRPVLIDFGALKEDFGESSRISSLVVVKEDYSPPEQQVPEKNRPMGFYTDIFALAGTMYAALAGRPPARAMARALTQGQDLYVPIAEASKVKAPDEVYRAIDRALSIDISQRPKDMAEFTSLLGWDVEESRISYPAKLAPEMNAALAINTEVAAQRNEPGGHSVAMPPQQRKSRIALIAALSVAAVIAGSFYLFSERSPQVTEAPKPAAPIEKKDSPSTADLERKTYENARGNISALRAYLASCKECHFRADAAVEIESLEKAMLAERESAEFARAKGNRELLQAYLNNCRICAHRAAASAALEALKSADVPKREAPKRQVFSGTNKIVREARINPQRPLPNCKIGEVYGVTFVVEGEKISLTTYQGGSFESGEPGQHVQDRIRPSV